jgi:outer membrane receptor protein involved in Fe transport
VKAFVPILSAVIAAGMTVVPAYAAPTPNNAPVTSAQNGSATLTTVEGTAKDDSSAPIAGAVITLHGPSTYTATTDATGAFSFAHVAPGLYRLVATKPGYDAATQDEFAVLVGQTQAVTVDLHRSTLTSIQTIGAVTAHGQSAFNTSTASVNVVTSQQFQDEGQIGLQRVLNQIPGVQNSNPGSSSNGAEPGSVKVTTIRGGLQYETATLIDGHPLADGDSGSFITTFLNSFMLGSVEVVKGPGAMSPDTNYAINGTVNYRTKDPTLTPTSDFNVGVLSDGGTFQNLGFSDTVLNKRLGFVVDVARLEDPSWLHGYTSYFTPGTNNEGIANWNGSTGTYLGPGSKSTTVPGTVSSIPNQYSLVGCCYTFNGGYQNTSELVKLRYHISQSTIFTASYLGAQSYADQNGNISWMYRATFVPGPGYTGSLAPGSSIMIPPVHPADNEYDNEPIFQGELSTTLGDDTILLRAYHASMNRLLYQGNQDRSTPLMMNSQLYGTSTTGGVTTVYNGQTLPLAIFDAMNQSTEDAVTGVSFQYDHPFGNGNDIAFSADRSYDTSVAFNDNTTVITPTTGNQFAGITQALSLTNPQGTSNAYSTYQLRTTYNFTPKVQGTLSLYENTYKDTFRYLCTSGNNCGIDGSNTLFETANTAHFDERFGLTYRPTNDLSVRASAGSSIAPAYLGLLGVVTGSPVPATSAQYGNYYTQTQNNPNIKPETAFGYDLGADLRVKGSTFLSTDLYFTNLFNHFLSSTYLAGTYNNEPLYVTTNTNVANTRYEGVEFSIKRLPRTGFGYNVGGALEKAFAYNLPANFYCSGPAATNCTPSNYNTNLAIIAGQNFNAGGVGVNGFSSSTNIPYFQGNAELNYTFPRGYFVALGDTFYGNNNAYNVPGFGIAYATLRIPVHKDLAVQISGDNVLNTLKNLFPTYGAGVPIVLANGKLAATEANTVGPATWTFQITNKF